MNNRKYILIIVLLLSPIFSSAQKFKIKYDTNLKTKEIIAKDTIVWIDMDSSKIQPRYPINCDVLLNKEIILHTCTLKHENYNYKLCFSHSSFSLRIDVVIIIDLKNGTYNGKIYYFDSALDPVERQFEFENCTLQMNKRTIGKGDIIQGKINLTFTGEYVDFETGKKIKKPGIVYGDFYVKAE